MSTFLNVYETGGDSDDTLPGSSLTQHYIDESIRQLADMTKDENVVYQEYLSQYNDLPRLYIKENIQDTEGLFDHRFGVHHDIELDKFSIGDSEINFVGPDMIIKNVRYKGTPRLYELSFKTNPIGLNKKNKR